MSGGACILLGYSFESFRFWPEENGEKVSGNENILALL
jgi:hypothetical protein